MNVSTLPELRRAYYAKRRDMIVSQRKAGVTQTEAAKALGVSLTCLNNIIKRDNIEWNYTRQGRNSLEGSK